MRRDLVVLVPDRNTEAVMEGLLARPESLRMRSITFRILVHPEKDPGCRLHGHELLRIHQNDYQFALMLFDREGWEAEEKSRIELEQAAEERLAGAGWKERGAVIVLDPEIDIWVWSDSPLVDEFVGWANRSPKLREWLRQSGYEFAGGIKPTRPKEALEAALKIARKPRSSSLYNSLASNVSLERCIDPAFAKLRRLLRDWFAT